MRGATCAIFMMTFTFHGLTQTRAGGKVPLRSGGAGFDKPDAQVDQKMRSGYPRPGAGKDNRSRLDCGAMPNQDLCICADLCGIESVLF
jgi:hypothetical protein